ncbi:MAG: carbohydrate ABC transporter permease, partial [Candidatus Hadarchaeales archaeon]
MAKRSGFLLKWIAISLISFFCIAPLLWGLKVSISPQYDTKLIPQYLTIEHYRYIFSRPEFLQYLRNSIIVSLGTVIFALPLSLLGGYALARFRFPGKEFSVLFLIFPLLPLIAVLVPLVSFLNRLGLYNKLSALVVVNTVFNLPLTIWMLRNFLLEVPPEIEEAALVDGCSRIEMLFRITIPLMIPGLVAATVFVFITTWNNYLYASALITKPSLRVLPQGILAFIGTWGTYWGGLTAAGIVT